VQALLDAVGINRAGEAVVDNIDDAIVSANKLGFPIVMKVVGPVHKSDVGGVVLNVDSDIKVKEEFIRMMQIPETTAILMQPMLSGTEIFIGATDEGEFGHMVLAGLGGIFIEVLKDVKHSLVPVSKDEAYKMIRNLKSYKLIKGIRGNEGVNEAKFVDAILKVSALLHYAPEIKEMDLNPLLGTAKNIIAVDARIRVEK